MLLVHQESKGVIKWELLAAVTRESHRELLLIRSCRSRLTSVVWVAVGQGSVGQLKSAGQRSYVRKVNGAALVSPVCQAQEQRFPQDSWGTGKQQEVSSGRANKAAEICLLDPLCSFQSLVMGTMTPSINHISEEGRGSRD